MLEKINNYLILKNPITMEEHFGKILDVDKHNKIKVKLIDDYNTNHYLKNREIEILIPFGTKLYHFVSTITFYDILEKTITINYPENIDKEINRKHKRYDINLELEIYKENHIIPSISYDISLGGLAFIVNDDIKFEETICLKIKVNNLKDIILKVEIIHAKRIRYDKKYYLLYSGQFIDFSKDEFDKLSLFFENLDGNYCVTSQITFDDYQDNT